MRQVAQELTSRPEVAAMIARGEERGCVNLSDFDELVQTLELMDDEKAALHKSAGAVKELVDVIKV